MKLIYIGLRMNQKYTEDLNREKEAFWRSFIYLQVVRDCLLSVKAGGIDNAEGAVIFLQSIIRGLEEGRSDKNIVATITKLRQLAASIEVIWNRSGGDLHYVEKVLEIELQNYWLAWKEDFVCRQIEAACNKAYEKVRHDPEEKSYKGHYMMVVALPEFLFHNDLGQEYTTFSQLPPGIPFLPFHQEVAVHFSQGALPEDNPGRMPGPVRHIRLLQFRKRGFQLLIFAGTIIWQVNKGESPYIYNTAYVFYNTNMVFAWDKQLVSEVDGASSIGSWRRPETINDPERSIPIEDEHYSASSLTAMFMELSCAIENKPMFVLNVFGEVFVFALTICREMVRDDLLQQLFCDIHVVLAFGIYPPYHIMYIQARQAFLYCDGRMPGVGSCVAAIEKGEEGYWEEDIRSSGRCQWQNINPENMILDKWCAMKAFSSEYEDPMLIWPKYIEVTGNQVEL